LSLITPKKGYKSVPWLFGKEIEIPEEWGYFPISEFVEKNTGNWGIEFEEPIPEGYTQAKIIRNTDFKNWDVDIGKNAPIRLIEKNKINQISLNEFDILFETSGGGPDQPLGRTIFVNKNAINNSTTPIAFSNFLIRFKIKNMNSKFLYYFLQRWYQTKLMKNFEKQTTNLRNFDMKFFLKAFPICSPKLQEQEKIVSILSNVDNLIESTGKVITHSKKVKKGLMQKLLTRGIGHTKFKKVPWLFGKEIEIPEEWEVKKIDDVFEFIISGTNARSDLNDSGEIRYIHYGDIHTKWNIQLDCDLDKIPQIDKEKVFRLQLLKEGDLIIADASEDVEGSGTSISLKNVKNKKIVAGLHTLVLRRKDENISFGFMKYLTSVSSIKIQIISWVTGAKVFGLTKASCKKIKVPLPPLPEQQKIASILSNIDSKITSQEQYKEKLEKLKKSLMQKLITGEIRVKL
jgi:type I restriction enzyme, S subunit